MSGLRRDRDCEEGEGVRYRRAQSMVGDREGDGLAVRWELGEPPPPAFATPETADQQQVGGGGSGQQKEVRYAPFPSPPLPPPPIPPPLPLHMQIRPYSR